MQSDEQQEYVDIRELVRQALPRTASISAVEYEGPEIAIYSKAPKILHDEGDMIKSLARKMRKRLVVRSAPEVRLPHEDAERAVRELVPEEAEITSVDFDDSRGEVIIEAQKPGLVIGRSGATLREITRQTFWRPSVIRTPPIESNLIKQIRYIVQSEAAKRNRTFREIGRRIHRPTLVNNGWIRLAALGGFREVGRQCMFLQTSESNVLIDCGVNVGTPTRAFPRFDMPEFSIEELDAVVVTHAHLDHCGMVPFLFKYGYKGPVYMTAPTLNLATLLQLDYLDVAEREGKLRPFRDKDVKESILHTIALNYGEVTDIAPDVRLTLHNAGHILGSSIVHLHVGDGMYNLAYTGDFKFGRTRLLEPATFTFPRLETLILESTYGHPTDKMPPRQEVERKLATVIRRTLERGGKVLIPVLAVGRAQEMMVVIEDLVSKRRIPKVPVYIEGMIAQATAIHTTHPEALSKKIREMIFHQGVNPFLSDIFVQVDHPEKREEIVEGGPCIIMATSGMMAGGPSVEYFRLLAAEEKNTLVFCSYQGENTLGRRIQKGWKEIQMRNREGKTTVIPVNLEVTTVEGFSGHSDRKQILNFVKRVNPSPERVLVCHGEASKCLNLASTIHKALNIDTKALMVTENIKLR
ncbi:MAG: beta-CASP ribonuclease aCPSF1 [Candidatus Thorarchaeota archaeon]|nr:MAG: beta-CASP ribonuclease aCPSF1 [Candidatus Thorarchaeota archaeon]